MCRELGSPGAGPSVRAAGCSWLLSLVSIASLEGCPSGIFGCLCVWAGGALQALVGMVPVVRPIRVPLPQHLFPVIH